MSDELDMDTRLADTPLSTKRVRMRYHRVEKGDAMSDDDMKIQEEANREIVRQRILNPVGNYKQGPMPGGKTTVIMQRSDFEELRRRLAQAEAALADVRAASHMPDDYKFGLPSWINQQLYGKLIAWTDVDGRPIRRSEDVEEMIRLKRQLAERIRVEQQQVDLGLITINPPGGSICHLCKEIILVNQQTLEDMRGLMHHACYAAEQLAAIHSAVDDVTAERDGLAAMVGEMRRIMAEANNALGSAYELLGRHKDDAPWYTMGLWAKMKWAIDAMSAALAQTPPAAFHAAVKEAETK